MDQYLGRQAPRRLMAAVGAGMGLANGVFTNVDIDYAPPLAGAPAELESLTVTVVTDSYHHNFEASGSFAGVEVQRFKPRMTKEPPRRQLISEWGLSLHARSVRGAETRNVLIDFGYTPETINNNLELLGIDPSSLDAMVLSHGHYDHFGGMVGFLNAHRRKLKPALPFYLGGEECFCAREYGTPENAGNYGVLDRHAIAEANLKVLYADKPSTVAAHGFTTGSIAKVSFERPLQPTRMKIGIGADGLGCAAARLPEDKRDAAMLVDDFQHEQATCFNVKGKGLVVITSCGHRGVVNSVHAAIKAAGVSKVHAVLGGFHLMPTPEEYARETAHELARFEPDCIIPMHCTGLKFYEAAKEALPGRVLLTSTGTSFTFGVAGAA